MYLKYRILNLFMDTLYPWKQILGNIKYPDGNFNFGFCFFPDLTILLGLTGSGYIVECLGSSWKSTLFGSVHTGEVATIYFLFRTMREL